MTGNREPKYKKSTVKQAVMVYMALQEHGQVMVESDGFRRYVYADGWDDAVIATTTGAPVSTVAILRRREYGDTKRCGRWVLPKEKTRETNPPPLTVGIEKLESTVVALTRSVSDHGARLARLESWLRDFAGEGTP